MVKKSVQKKRTKCNNCDSSFGYVRVKEGEWVCRNCGNIQKIKRGDKDGRKTS